MSQVMLTNMDPPGVHIRERSNYSTKDAKEKMITMLVMKKFILGTVLTVSGLLSLTGCGSATSASTPTAPNIVPTTGTGNTTPESGMQRVTISAKDNMFDPMSYIVEAGKPVKLTVVNNGQEIHEVEVKDLIPETKLSPGQSKSVDLGVLQPGTHRIYCEIHGDQGMEGQFVVK